MMRFLKKTVALFLALAVIFSLMSGIAPSVNAAPATVEEKDGNLRVIITSDIHYQPHDYYGVGMTDRVNLWFNAIHEEHEREPIDLILINGDVSLDHYYNGNGTPAGTYMGDNKVSYTEKFVKDYASRLPEGVPYLIIAGNHEQYNNEQWKNYVGNDRQCYISMEGNLFILLDNFHNHLEPNATANPSYDQSDVDYIKEIMAMYPDDNVWLISHYFTPTSESADFCELVANTDRIIGLFGGHDHMNNVKYVSQWGGKPYAMTGGFARSGVITTTNIYGEPQRYGYTAKELTEQEQAWVEANLNAFWGFRELVISPNSAYSNFIGVDTKDTEPYFFGRKISLPRRISDSVTYTLPANAPTENWGPAADGIYYIGSPNDMLAFNKAAQKDNFADKTVKLLRDIDMVGLSWTMIPTFCGTFDGAGHEIRNFSTNVKQENLAMINVLENGKICNLRMTDGVIDNTGYHTAAVFAVQTKGESYFENVYSRMTVKTDSAHYRVGGFVGFVSAGTVHFDRCVSECAFEGMRAGGFVSQVNMNGSVELTDCAFIGDMSAAGKWSSGMTGLTVGHVKMTRCVSLGKPSKHAESGVLVYLDHQNQSTSFVGNAEFTDCYAAVDTTPAIGAHSGRSFRFNFRMSYTGGASYELNTTSTSTLAANMANVENIFGYLAKGSAVNLTASNFKTLCSNLTEWSIAGGTVAYGEGKTVIKILPKGLAELISGAAAEPIPEGLCPFCGGKQSIGENRGDGTHSLVCDRCDNSLFTSHNYVEGLCACGQHENDFVLLDFLKNSEKNQEADWITTDVDTGKLSLSIDTSGCGTASGSVQFRDAYLHTASALAQNYVIKSGDIVELRIKAKITAGSTQKTAIYFTTAESPRFEEVKQLAVDPSFNGEYQVLHMGSLNDYAGQTLQRLRFDIFQHGSTNLEGDYEIDYLYIGSPETAPSKGNQNLFFDFTDDASAARRYATSIYNGYNYDVRTNWVRNDGVALSADSKAGTLTVPLTETGSITGIEPDAEAKLFKWGNESSGLAKNLYYDPSNAEILQIRMKLDGVESTSTKQYFRFFYHGAGAPLWSSLNNGNEYYESILTAISNEYLKGGAKDGEYFTLTLSLKDRKFTTYDAIDGIMLNFFNMQKGSVTIDYLYIGPKTDHLLFDFEQDETANRRYDNVIYRDYDFDSTSHWYSGSSIDEVCVAEGELTLNIAAEDAGEHNRYLQTCAENPSVIHPLNFTPAKNDIILLRYKVKDYDAALNAETVPSLTIYGFDNGTNTYQGTSWATADLDGYTVQAWPVPANWSSYRLTALRITARGLLNSSVSIDYLYVGPADKAPVQPYTVRFMNEDTLLATEKTYTDAVAYTGSTPTKAFDADWHYIFKGWVDAQNNAVDLNAIAGDMTVYAAYDKVAHSIAATLTDTETHLLSCACGFSKTEAHAWDKGSITTQPTCTAAGTMTYTCSVCKGVRTEVIEGKGHKVVTDAKTAPSCTETGLTEGKHCETCGEVIVKQEVIPALGHIEIIDAPIAADCVSAGKTEGKHCDRCGEVLIAQETIPATGHVNTTTETTEATCTEDGLAVISCACGELVSTEIIAALGHDYDVDYTLPTCTENGVCKVICTRCCEMLYTETMPAQGHSFVYIDTGDSHKVICKNRCNATDEHGANCEHGCDFNVTETHSFVEETCICGAVEVTEPTLDSSLSFGANLVLENDLTMNFRVRSNKLTSYDISTAYIVVQRDIYATGAKEPTVETTVISDYTVEGDRLVFSYPGIAAAQMNDDITAVLFIKDAKGKEFVGPALETSVTANLNGLLGAYAADAKMVTLIMDMVNYGAAAQIYFDRHTDALANEAYENFITYASYASADFTTQLENLATTENTEGKAGKLNLGLDLGTRIGIQYKVTVPANVNVEDVSLVVTDASGNVLETLTVAGNATDSKGRYIVNFYGNTSTQMRRMVYATAYANGEAITGTYGYTVSTYAWGIQENANLQPAELVNVTRAMMLYGDSASAYFGG